MNILKQMFKIQNNCATEWHQNRLGLNVGIVSGLHGIRSLPETQPSDWHDQM